MSDRYSFSQGSGSGNVVAKLEELKTLLTNIDTDTDNLADIETLLTTTNALITAVAADTDYLQTIDDDTGTIRTIIARIEQNILGNTTSLYQDIEDTLNAIQVLITTSNLILQDIDDNTDTLETLLAVLATISTSLIGILGNQTDGDQKTRICSPDGSLTVAVDDVTGDGDAYTQDRLLVDAVLRGNNGVTLDTLKLDAQDNLYVSLRDAGGATFDVRSITSDGVGTGNGLWVASQLLAWNGSSYDRLRVNADKDLKVTRDTSRYTVNFEKENLGASESFILVDLSDSASFPHTNTSFVKIYAIIININGDTSFRGDVEIGFIEEVDATDSTTHPLMTIHHDQSVSDHEQYIKFDDPIKCAVSNHLSNAKNTTNTNFQTDVSLDSPKGDTSSPAGPGDIYLDLVRTAGNVDISITLVYDTE